jgi:hypothetical protein
MASKKWLTLPGGRIKRWKKSRTEDRPGWGSSAFPIRSRPAGFGTATTARSAAAGAPPLRWALPRLGRTFTPARPRGTGSWWNSPRLSGK